MLLAVTRAALFFLLGILSTGLSGRAFAEGDIHLCVAEDHSRVNCQGAIFIFDGKVGADLKGVLLRSLEKRVASIKTEINEQAEGQDANLQAKLQELREQWN